VDRQHALFEDLPVDLQQRAVDLHESGVAEIAYRVADADAVLRTIADRAWALLGGDLWELTAQGPKPTGDNWYVDEQKSESDEAFASRGQAAARLFVRRAGSSPDYLLTFVLR
jgi:hypothetical protein